MGGARRGGATAQGDVNRPWFLHRLGDALASVPSLHEVLSQGGARIADIGMGHGWSSIALAQAYPSARVEGFDVDAESVIAARRHADEAHVGDRVRFHHVAGEGTPQEAVFDAAFVFEALHDMPFPVEVLTAIRRAVKRDGEVVIMDEAVAEAFAPDGDDVERIMYGYSIFMCLPDGLSTPGSVGTGTVMRPVDARAVRRGGVLGHRGCCRSRGSPSSASRGCSAERTLRAAGAHSCARAQTGHPAATFFGR